MLSVGWPGGNAKFALGPEAEKWLLRIRYPRGLLDKLGVKPGQRIAVLGIEDESFWEPLRARTADIAEGRPKEGSDLVFVKMQSTAELPQLVSLRASIKPNGAIWVVWPKGRKDFREDHVRAYGPRVGLVDVKVVSFSETLSALKLVIPVKLR